MQGPNSHNILRRSISGTLYYTRNLKSMLAAIIEASAFPWNHGLGFRVMKTSS